MDPTRPGKDTRRERRLFDLVVMVDWSAASDRGPAAPAENRCWVAWGTPDERPAPEYFRTRWDAERFVQDLLVGGPRRALVCFDFPYGYPDGSGLGGGRVLAARLARLIEDDRAGANNRFEVAAAVNAELGDGGPGPFWNCPPGKATATLTQHKPSFNGRGFGEWRIVEQRLKSRGIQSPWKLFTSGSVGSQALVGLPAVHRLLTAPELADRSRLWPFETGWGGFLDGIIHAEIWPSLGDVEGQPYAIKDARQVAAMRDWVLGLDGSGALGRWFARPAGLSRREERICRRHEGWILGVG